MSIARRLSSGIAVVVAVGLAASAPTRADEIFVFEKPPYSDSSATADEMALQQLIVSGQLDKAMIAAEALERRQPKKASTFNLKGMIYSEKNDVPNARSNFERALALEPDSKVAIINLAQLDLRQKNPEAARQRLQGLLAKDKNDVDVMLGLALVAASTNDEADYLSWLEKANKSSPLALRPRVMLVDYLIKKREPGKALAIAREAPALSPKDPKAVELLGTAQLLAGEGENAVATFSKQVSMAPNDPVAHFKLATAYASMQNATATTAALQKALALKPDYLEAEIMLASAELAGRRYDQALKIAQRIQGKYPQLATGFGLQGNILMEQKQYSAALSAYEKALSINKAGPLMLRIHQAMTANGNGKEAETRMQRWLREQPNDVPTRAYFAASYMKAGNNKSAIEQYQRLLDFDSRNVRALNDLAWLYQQEKDPRALATAERAYQYDPGRPEIMDTLGWILVQQGQNARGMELLKKAADGLPGSGDVRFHLAAAMAKAGDKAGARKELEDLLAKNSTFPQREEAQNLLRQL
jgi:putative PEP-CTERM system TPR-repeat lipoprotein